MSNFLRINLNKSCLCAKLFSKEIKMSWYSLRQLAKELGMAPNTFKKYYLEKYPPDRESKTYKGWTSQSVEKIKVEIQGAN